MFAVHFFVPLDIEEEVFYLNYLVFPLLVLDIKLVTGNSNGNEEFSAFTEFRFKRQNIQRERGGIISGIFFLQQLIDGELAT